MKVVMKKQKGEIPVILNGSFPATIGHTLKYVTLEPTDFKDPEKLFDYLTTLSTRIDPKDLQ